MDVSLPEWQKVYIERAIIDSFRANGWFGYSLMGINKTEIKLIEQEMKIILKKDMKNGVFTSRKDKDGKIEKNRILDQLRIANVCFLEISEETHFGMLYYRDGYFIHLEENTLHCIWKSVGDTMIGEAPIGGAFNELRKLVQTMVVLGIEKPTQGTLKMLSKNNVPLWIDKECTKELPEGKSATMIYIRVADMPAPVEEEDVESPDKKKVKEIECNVCGDRATGECYGFYYCSVNCQSVDYLNGVLIL